MFLSKQVENVIASRFPTELKAKRPEVSVEKEEKIKASIQSLSHTALRSRPNCLGMELFNSVQRCSSAACFFPQSNFNIPSNYLEPQ